MKLIISFFSVEADANNKLEHQTTTSVSNCKEPLNETLLNQKSQ